LGEFISGKTQNIMNNFIKNISIFVCLLLPIFSIGQSKWFGELKLSSVDCKAKEACYYINLKGNEATPWALGDQNYRLFYDAANISVISAKSLLPAGVYGNVQINEILELVNQGQEDYSPLDVIDQYLGFLDLSIISYAKENPELAVKLPTAEPISVVEVCFSVSDQMFEEGQENAMNIYFSRPETSGQVTNQYSVITEIDAVNHTVGTKVSAFSDISYHVGTDAQLAVHCETNSINNVLARELISVYPNPIRKGGSVTYELKATELEGEHTVSIYDLTGKLMSIYEKLPAENNQIQLDERFTAGTYFMRIKFDTQVANASFAVINP